MSVANEESYETHNVSLWILNDEGLYLEARRCSSYSKFVDSMAELGVTETPDGVSYTDPNVDTDAMDALWEDL